SALDTSQKSTIRQKLDQTSEGLVNAAEQILTESKNLLILVDQFEEIFRFKLAAQKDDDRDAAAKFIKLLLATAMQDTSPIYVVLTLRSDLLGDCSQSRGLPEPLNDGQYLVPRLNRTQQKEAIEGPVAVAGASISPRLDQELLNDVEDDPDQLPILQHALM